MGLNALGLWRRRWLYGGGQLARCHVIDRHPAPQHFALHKKRKHRLNQFLQSDFCSFLCRVACVRACTLTSGRAAAATKQLLHIINQWGDIREGTGSSDSVFLPSAAFCSHPPLPPTNHHPRPATPPPHPLPALKANVAVGGSAVV